MIAKARARYLRVSPTKIRLVIDLIRGRGIADSRAILMHTKKGSSQLVSKVLNSAVDNAREKGLQEDQLYVSKIIADQGSVWKRHRAISFGRAAGILKKTTHLTIELDVVTK